MSFAQHAMMVFFGISERGTLQTLLTGQIPFHVIVLSGRIGLPAWNITKPRRSIPTQPTSRGFFNIAKL